MGETVYRFLSDDVREGICDSMGVLNATNPPTGWLSPADSGAGRATEDASERRRRR
jgi:hypothetical protein